MAGYGSAKDISVYSSLGLLPSQIYIVGRAVKKLQSQCQVGASAVIQAQGRKLAGMDGGGQ